VEMWTMKAASEFELEKYAESKASFERVLALDPGNRGANTYLVDIERFANPNSGVIRYNSNDDVDQSYVEAKLGFIPNPEIFEFYKAIQLESEAPAVEKFTASYLASEAFGGSFAAVIKSLKDTLKTAGVAYEEHPQDGLTSLTVKLTDSEGPLLGYTLSVIDQKPFELAIYYEN